MKANSFQVANARLAASHYPVTAMIENRPGDEWYTRNLMEVYPNGVPACDPFPLMFTQLTSPVKNPDALNRLIVLTAAQVSSPENGQRLIPVTGGLPQDYTDVLMRQGPFAALQADPAVHPDMEKAALAMYCLIYMRALVKDETYMSRMPEKARNIIRGVYGYELNLVPLLDAVQLKGFKDFLRRRDPVVMGLVRGAVETEHNLKGVEGAAAKRGLQTLNAGLLLNLRYYGYGCLTMFFRMNQKVEADINRLVEGFAGTAYAPALVSIMFVMIVYAEPDEDRRAHMIDAFGIEGAPDIDQRGWQYGRVFKEDCMNIIASKTHDTFISLCLNIYNRLNPDNPIRNYRPLSSGVSKEAENAFAEAFQKHFASGLVSPEKGFVAATAEVIMGAPAAPPPQNNVAVQVPAAPPAMVIDEDI